MGVAAYNRGSKIIRQQADREVEAIRRREVRPMRSEVKAPATTTQSNDWKIDDQAFCIVSASRGWYRVRDVKGSGRSQMIKIDGVGSWCPVYNFRRSEQS